MQTSKDLVSSNKFDVSNPKKIGIFSSKWLLVCVILFFAYLLRSYGSFYRFPFGGNEDTFVPVALKLNSILLKGYYRLFVKNLFDGFARPGTYVLNVIGVLLGGKTGLYFIYAIYGLISLLILHSLSSKLFNSRAAIGALFLGSFSIVHISYSMKVHAAIPSFMLGALSLYFFLQSNYGNHPLRDKILGGVLIGIAFSCHYSFGTFPFVYILAEVYIYLTEEDKRKGWVGRFFALLISMALPVIFWEGLSCFIRLTYSPSCQYIGRLLSHENLTIAEAISPLYFISLLFHLEHFLFIVFAAFGLVAAKKLKKKQKTFLVMLGFLCIFNALFPPLACMLRFVFPLYLFLVPIAGFGLSTLYSYLRKRSVLLCNFAVLLVFVLLGRNALNAVKVISHQQKIPYEVFNVLKENGISRIILSRHSVIPTPFLDKRSERKFEKIVDATGYALEIHFAPTNDMLIPLAKKTGIKYLLAHYCDYWLGPGPYHYMFMLHDKGLGKPLYSWGGEYEFPLTYFDEEPFKVQAYDRLYAQRKIPIHSRNMVFRSMLYDISPLLN